MFSLKPLAYSLAIAAALGAGVAVSPTRAADLDVPYAEAAPPALDQNVEFGTGWYIRGDIGFAKDSMPIITPDLTQFLASGLQNSVNLSGGFGYKFNNMFRTDLTLDWFNPIAASGPGPSITCTTQLTTISNIPTVTATDNCTPRGNANIQRWAVLTNGYVDLGTWSGFTPYVGAGVGVGIIRQTSSVNYFMSNGLPYQVTTDGFFFNLDHNEASIRYQFAWALMAGVSYAVTSHISLDLGYRYLNLGTINTFQNASGQISTHSLYEQEVRLGIRYMID
jgi:opacity protein-like surface antigen